MCPPQPAPSGHDSGVAEDSDERSVTDGVDLTSSILIASPRLDDPNFNRTVVLVLDHGEEGALGVVLNRPTSLDVDEILEPWQDQAELTPPALVFRGGPVSPDAVIGLARSAEPPAPDASWRAVIGGSARSTSPSPPVTSPSRSPASGSSPAMPGGSAGSSRPRSTKAGGSSSTRCADDVFSDDPEQLWHDVLQPAGRRIRAARHLSAASLAQLSAPLRPRASTAPEGTAPDTMPPVQGSTEGHAGGTWCAVSGSPTSLRWSRCSCAPSTTTRSRTTSSVARSAIIEGCGGSSTSRCDGSTWPTAKCGRPRTSPALRLWSPPGRPRPGMRDLVRLLPLVGDLLGVGPRRRARGTLVGRRRTGAPRGAALVPGRARHRPGPPRARGRAARCWPRSSAGSTSRACPPISRRRRRRTSPSTCATASP